MTLSVTVTIQEASAGGYEFVYSSPDSILGSLDGVTTISVPQGPQMLSLTLETSVPDTTAEFIEDPVVWVTEVGALRGTPPRMGLVRLSNTQLLATVDNVNLGPGEIHLPFFLVVLMRGPGVAEIRIVGHDPILIEDPPGG